MLRLRYVLRVTAFVAALLSFPHSLFAGASCQLNPANRTVTICTPQNNSTVATTFHVNAGVTDSIQIQYMQVYVNHVLYATQRRNFIDATITVPAAQNALLTVQAREVNSSFFIKAHYTINIGSQLVLTPQHPSLVENAMQQFTTAPIVPVNWTASCGSINSSGNYTAPLAPGSCTVTATATDGSGVTGSTTATITSPISIMPPSATTLAGGTQQFTATAQVNWSASCGAIDATGLFTAPNAPGTCTITATAATGIAFTAMAIDTVGPPPPLVVTPANPSIVENAMQQFTTTPVVPANWSASCGTINTSGNYTAPLVPGACTVTATATDGSGRTASTTATITSPITITPPSATTLVNMTQQFSANAGVNWSASCGTINSGGLFTAPANAGTCTITATASSGTAFTAQAIDTVTNPAGISYTTWKNDSGRTGLNSSETILKLSNVNSTNFGKLFKTTVDGGVWTQPLYMAGLTVNHATHNVLFAGTDNDTMYALDADSGSQLWKKSFLSTGVTPVPQANVHSTIYPHVGITGTPVIDSASGTLYVVAETLENSGTSYVHRLHALDVTTGNEKFGGPVVITAAGFQPKEQLQRPGLLLANGNVYIGFGSQGDYDPYHGWLFAYNPTSLGQTAAWNITDDNGPKPRGAIWMGGSGIASDSEGNIYVATSNGDFDGVTLFGQSVIKLSPALTVLDYFTPYNNAYQTGQDWDLGSGGVLLVPDQAGPYPNEIIICGKPMPIYVIDRNHMSHIGNGSDNIIQEVTNQLGGPGHQSDNASFTTPAYWNQNVYFIANNDSLKMFSLSPTTGLLSTTPVSKDTFIYAFPGGQAVVSSNGLSNAIVWGYDYTTGTLHAYDATNVSHVLYVSPALGKGIKYPVPTVINGHVYVGGNKAIFGFGLTGQQQSCTPPPSPGVNVCAPVAGQAYSSPVQFTAAGTDPTGTVSHMELWIDNVKVNNYPGNMINTSAVLPVGAHSATAIEVGPNGGFIKSNPVAFTVH